MHPGSALEDPTSWTPTASNNSFEDILEGSGAIVAARLIELCRGVDRRGLTWSVLGNPNRPTNDQVGKDCARGFNSVTVVSQSAVG